MDDRLRDLLQAVNDEASFNRFLVALREDCESRECPPYAHNCIEEGHWQTRETKYFLRSVEDWATRGDFADGVHHGEPLLRRFATMLYVGKYYRPEDRP